LDLIVGMALDYWGDIKYSIEEVFKLFATEMQLGFLKFLKAYSPLPHAMKKNKGWLRQKLLKKYNPMQKFQGLH
jgi:hypothetical protein